MRQKILFACSILLLVFYACSNDDKDSGDAPLDPTGIFDFSVEKLEYKNEGGRRTIKLTSLSDWTTSYPKWIKVLPDQGVKGTHTLTIILDKNNTSSERRASIEFVSGTSKAYLEVVQNGNNATPIISKKVSKITWSSTTPSPFDGPIVRKGTDIFNYAENSVEVLQTGGGSHDSRLYRYKFDDKKITVEFKASNRYDNSRDIHKIYYLSLNQQGYLSESHYEDLIKNSPLRSDHSFFYNNNFLSRVMLIDYSPWNLIYNNGLMTELSGRHMQSHIEYYADLEDKIGLTFLPNIGEFSDGSTDVYENTNPNNILYQMGYLGQKSSKLIRIHTDQNKCTCTYRYDLDSEGYPTTIYRKFTNVMLTPLHIVDEVINIEYL